MTLFTLGPSCLLPGKWFFQDIFGVVSRIEDNNFSVWSGHHASIDVLVARKGENLEAAVHIETQTGLIPTVNLEVSISAIFLHGPCNMSSCIIIQPLTRIKFVRKAAQRYTHPPSAVTRNQQQLLCRPVRLALRQLDRRASEHRNWDRPTS